MQQQTKTVQLLSVLCC